MGCTQPLLVSRPGPQPETLAACSGPEFGCRWGVGRRERTRLTLLFEDKGRDKNGTASARLGLDS